MTKKMVLAATLGLMVLGGSLVYAGMGCNGGAGMFGKNPDLEKVRTFQAQTGSLRDEMMIKRLELSQELEKATPDKNRIETLRKDMIEIRTKLQNSATSLGLTGGCLTECNLDPVECVKTDCNYGSGNKGAKGKGLKSGGCGNCNKK